MLEWNNLDLTQNHSLTLCSFKWKRGWHVLFLGVFFHIARRTKLWNYIQDNFFCDKLNGSYTFEYIWYRHYVYERKLTEISKRLIHTSCLLLSSPHSDWWPLSPVHKSCSLGPPCKPCTPLSDFLPTIVQCFIYRNTLLIQAWNQILTSSFILLNHFFSLEQMPHWWYMSKIQ